MSLEQIEEWLLKKEPTLRGWLSKAFALFLSVIVPLLVMLSEATGWTKAAGSAIWLLMLLSAWLVTLLAISRAKVRQLEAEMAKALEPPPVVLPQLEGVDLAVLRYLARMGMGCGAMRIGAEIGRELGDTLCCLDHLEAWEFVVKVGPALGGEFVATPKGREKVRSLKGGL